MMVRWRTLDRMLPLLLLIPAFCWAAAPVPRVWLVQPQSRILEHDPTSPRLAETKCPTMKKDQGRLSLAVFAGKDLRVFCKFIFEQLEFFQIYKSSFNYFLWSLWARLEVVGFTKFTIPGTWWLWFPPSDPGQGHQIPTNWAPRNHLVIRSSLGKFLARKLL